MDNKENKNTRRDFLLKSLTFGGIALTMPVLASIAESCTKNEATTGPSGGTETVDIANYVSLQNIDGAFKITFSGKNNNLPVMIIRLSQTQFIVLSTTCKHQGCEVSLPNGNTIVCPCHGANYSTLDGHVTRKPSDGSNISGLTVFSNTFNQSTGILTINF